MRLSAALIDPHSSWPWVCKLSYTVRLAAAWSWYADLIWAQVCFRKQDKVLISDKTFLAPVGLQVVFKQSSSSLHKASMLIRGHALQRAESVLIFKSI